MEENYKKNVQLGLVFERPSKDGSGWFRSLSVKPFVPHKKVKYLVLKVAGDDDTESALTKYGLPINFREIDLNKERDNERFGVHKFPGPSRPVSIATISNKENVTLIYDDGTMEDNIGIFSDKAQQVE